MSDPTTKSPAISRREAEELIAKMARDLASAMGHGGANVNVGVQDQRLSKILSWAWITIGGVGVSAIMFVASTMLSLKESVVDLNGKISVVIAQRDSDVQNTKRELDDIKLRVHDIEQSKK